jgi:hypothetical protein
LLKACEKLGIYWQAISLLNEFWQLLYHTLAVALLFFLFLLLFLLELQLFQLILLLLLLLLHTRHNGIIQLLFVQILRSTTIAIGSYSHCLVSWRKETSYFLVPELRLVVELCKCGVFS